ncbi:MAG: toll/interleukin-1 receptor domain-containing protein [Solobacterium sp.]|nr:toll/interleukin-1 receptor domain-containing protein [Solobacterium sp.]
MKETLGNLFIVYGIQYRPAALYLAHKLKEMKICVQNSELKEYKADALFEDITLYSTIQPFNTEPDSPEYRAMLKKSDTVVILFGHTASIDPDYQNTVAAYIRQAQDRAKQVIIITDAPRWMYKDVLPAEERYLFFKDENIWLFAEDGLIVHSMTLISAMIYNRITQSTEKEKLYEKLTRFSEMDYTDGILETQSDLIEALWKEWESAAEAEKRGICKEVLRLMSRMQQKYPSFSQDSSRVTHRQLNVLAPVHSAAAEQKLPEQDLYYDAWAVTEIYLFALIQHVCVEAITNDDIHLLREPERINAFVQQQEPYYVRIHASEAEIGSYPEDEQKLIRECGKYRMDQIFCDSHGVILRRREDGKCDSPFTVRTEEEKQEADTAELKLLKSAAEILNNGMDLLKEVSDNGKAAEYLRCLKTGYERLKNYSEIIGAKKTAAECITQMVEVQNRLDRITADSDPADPAEKGIRSLLGLKQPADHEYDVFLSYKHEDADIARSVYHYLQENHRKPFFDQITLPELSQSDYEEAIMNSLDHAQHFAVIITDLSQLQSHWIKLEMKIFEHEMSEGRKLGSNFIFIVSDDVYAKVNADKKLLPIQYRGFEIMSVREYRSKLINYVQ